MKKNRLGKTGLEVTQLSYGAMELRGKSQWDGRAVSGQQAERILNAVLDAGINFIDTAPDYGTSEEFIGRYISTRRDEFFLATKCGCDPEDKGGKGGHLWTSDQLRHNIEGSLKRMKTDYVDILQLHNPEPDKAPIYELIETLREIKDHGLTRIIGISTTLPWLSQYLAMDVFDTFQIPYSCLEPQHHDVISQVAEAGAGVIIRGGIGKGGPRAEQLQRVNLEVWKKAGLDELCHDITPAELILRYTLSHPHFQTSIVGTMNPEHLADNLKAVEKGPLPADLYREINQRVAKNQP